MKSLLPYGHTCLFFPYWKLDDWIVVSPPILTRWINVPAAANDS